MLGCNTQGPTRDEDRIDTLLYDSRLLARAASTLFFALKTASNDGHKFIPALYSRGVRHFVVEQAVPQTSFPEAVFYTCHNSLEALQQLASLHRKAYSLPIIGITGSNGKTIVKEWLYQLLVADYKIVRSPGSYNSQLGVPLSVWQIDESHDLGIFEAGISEPGKMSRLAQVIQPSIGIFTNIGKAHAAAFASQADKIAEKAKLFESCQTIICCKNHSGIYQYLREFYPSKRIVAWHEFDESLNDIVAALPFNDDASRENAMHCAVLMLELGYSADTIMQGIQKLKPISLRLELKRAVNRCALVNDSYSADVSSLQVAADFLKRQYPSFRKTLILSDILQSGLSPELLYTEVAELVKSRDFSRIIGIGTEIKVLQNFLPSTIQQAYFQDTDEFLAQYKQEDFHDEAILLKGARTFAFEHIATRLEEKSHRTVLEINLNALLHNLNVYRQHLAPGTRVMGMVKAAGYGSGSPEVARLLEMRGTEYLAVAYADEGVDLRVAGISLPILVLNPEPGTFDLMLRYELEPEIYSIELLKAYIEFAAARANTRKCPAIHLKIETGMNRLGLDAKDWNSLCQILQLNPNVEVASVFTHLVASEASEHDAFTKLQVERYETAYNMIVEAINDKPLRHVLNTGGIIRFPQYHFDMVRLGVGLYGYDSSAQIQAQLSPVSTLKAYVSQVKQVPKGETVGYNRRGVAQEDMITATIGIGYADGWPRKLGNGRFSVLIKGKRAPIVGNVCMDMCMVDVTHIPGVKQGDEAIMFGNEPSIQEVAAVLETIPYEVLTMVSERVTRLCYQD
jgi:alanine racemase